MSQVDLCVVNFNTAQKVQRLVETLAADDNDSWNLYIADNGSTDGSISMLRLLEAKYPITAVVYNANIGYARACNQLAAMGDSEYLGLLNADVWMTSQDVSGVIQSFGQFPEAHIIGPKQRDELGHITHAGIFGSNTAPQHRGWKQPDRNDTLYRDFLPAVTVSGSAYFVRRATWDALTACEVFREIDPEAQGAFLTTPHYYEETWCSYHARAHGYGVYYDGTVSMGHSWHASSAVGGAADRQFVVSQQIFRNACDHHGISRD